MKEECLEEREWVTLLALGGGDERKVGAEGLRADGGPVAETDFAEDDGETEGLLCVVVGGFHTVDIEEGKDTIGIAVWINESLPEIFGMGIVQAGMADGIEYALTFRFARLGFREGHSA